MGHIGIPILAGAVRPPGAGEELLIQERCHARRDPCERMQRDEFAASTDLRSVTVCQPVVEGERQFFDR